MIRLLLWPVCICLIGGVFFWVLASSTWQPSVPVLEKHAPQIDVSLKGPELESYCQRSRLSLPGATPSIQCPALREIATRIYGKEVAFTLWQACNDHRLVPARDEILFPKPGLCKEENLPQVCKTLCDQLRG